MKGQKPKKRTVDGGQVTTRFIRIFRDCYIGLNDGDESSWERLDSKAVATICSLLAGVWMDLDNRITALEEKK